MANTRGSLAEVGRRALNDEAQLIEAGKRTIRDVVQKALVDAGIEEAVGFELKLVNGETISITSDSNPALNRPAEDVQEVNVRQSAKAGGWTIEVHTTFTRMAN